MKDRIRLIMEEQHMSQQVFADFIGLSPATLSSIFSGRTRPTLNVVEAIKKKIPLISTDWLMMGIGDMHVGGESAASAADDEQPAVAAEGVLAFDGALPDRAASVPSATYQQSVRNTRLEMAVDEKKYLDRHMRKVTEIRVYYDDQTYETFVPAKSK